MTEPAPTAPTPPPPPPWHAAYPSPRTTNPQTITRATLLEKLRAGQRPGVDFLLVDLRRTDHEVRYVT